MTRFPALALLLLSLLPRTDAQSASPPPSATYLAGTVVDEPGSHPLKKVLVQVVAEDQHQNANYIATTDTDGHFRVDNILPGRYRVFFEKSGFAEVNGRGHRADVNVVTVPADKPLDDLVFHMLPTAAITGRVTDEDGDPMSGVRVIIQKKMPGKAKRGSMGAAATNDLGEYRVSGLFPGQYWVAALPPPDSRDYERPRAKAAAGSAEGQPETRYVNTYYPGTTDGAQASPIALKAGGEMPVNLTLVPTQTYRVRGIVTSLVPGQRSSVELLSKAGDSALGGEVGSDGTFEIHGASPGSYVLKAYTTAESSVVTARQDVTIAAADIDGLKLVPMPAFAIAGHLRADAQGVGAQASVDLSQYSVNLRLADISDDPGFFMFQDSFGENAQVDRLGNFSWKNVNPGNYILRLYGGNGQGSSFLKSARLGANIIDASFALSGPAVLDLVVSTRGAILEGVVTDRDQQGNDAPVSNVQVVAVPDERYRKIPERFGEGATDQFGRFTIRGLAPGNYTLFAWQDVSDDVYRDADFLKSQEANGVTVKVEEGTHQSTNLKLSAIGDDWK